MSEPRSHLTDLPPEIKLKIVSYLDTPSKLSVRQCSKNLKNIVDSGPMHFEQLSIGMDGEKLQIGLQKREKIECLWFKPAENGGYFVQTLENFWAKNEGNFHENGNYIDAAIEKLMEILRKPRIFLEELSISLKSDKKMILEKLNAAFSTLDHKIPARKLDFCHPEKLSDVGRILPFLKPKTLEELYSWGNGANGDDSESEDDYDDEDEDEDVAPDPHVIKEADVQEIETLDLEQWKQMEKLRLEGWVLEGSMEKMEHLKELVCKTNEKFSLEAVEHIVKNMLRPDGWNHRSIKWFDFDERDFIEYVTQLLQDDLGHGYRVSVKKGKLVDYGRPKTLVVRIDGPKLAASSGPRRCVIKLEKLRRHHWSYHPSTRRVFFTNPDAPKPPMAIYFMELRQKVKEEQEQQARRDAESKNWFQDFLSRQLLKKEPLEEEKKKLEDDSKNNEEVEDGAGPSQ